MKDYLSIIWKWFNSTITTEFSKEQGTSTDGFKMKSTIGFICRFLKELLKVERGVSGCNVPWGQLPNNDCALSHFWKISKRILCWQMLIKSICLCPWEGTTSHYFGNGHPESDQIVIADTSDFPFFFFFCSILCIYPNLVFFLQRHLTMLVSSLVLKSNKRISMVVEELD